MQVQLHGTGKQTMASFGISLSDDDVNNRSYAKHRVPTC